MQDVFEKIIEKLEELNIESQLCSKCAYREECDAIQEKNDIADNVCLCTMLMKLKSVEIVKQEAEEYKDRLVSAEVYKQVAWERDIAIEQLHELGFELGEDVSNNGWVPCEKEMPKEHDSIFARYKGTDKWNDSMFEKISDEVNVTIADKKGNTVVTHAHTADGKWSCDLLRVNKYYRVIAWQPMPTEYKQNGE